MLYEAYLDDENQVWDYKTAPIDGDNVIDTTKTGTGFGDNFLDASSLKYQQSKKNLTGSITMMTPREYFDRCARDIFNTTAANLVAQREHDKDINKMLDRVLNEFKIKLCLPYIDYANNGQEGLHRMLAIARNYSWDKEVPVLVIDYYDKDRAEQEKDREFVARLTNKLYDALRDAAEYHYANFDEFTDQLQWSLDRAFRYEDEVTKPVNVTITQENDDYIVTLEQFTSVIAEMPVNALQMNRVIDDDEFDIEDLEEDFSETYLFHGTNNIKPIVETDTLKLGRRYADGQAVCLTRNFEFAKRFDYIIVLDRRKLNNDYSLKLKSDSKNMRNTFSRIINGQSKAEEVSIKDIKNLHRYIVGIVTDKELDCNYKIVPKTNTTRATLTKQLTESYDADMKGWLITLLDNYVDCYYESSKYACQAICEELCYEHNLDATFRGRTIYIDNDKIATLQAQKDGPNLVAITGYKLYI